MVASLCVPLWQQLAQGDQEPKGSYWHKLKMATHAHCVLAVVIALGRLSIRSGQTETIQSSLRIGQAREGRDEPNCHVQNLPQRSTSISCLCHTNIAQNYI